MNRPYPRPRLVATSARRVLITALMLSALGVVPACGSSASEIRARQESDAPSPPEILFNAIIAEYEAREIPIATQSAKHLLVAGEFQDVNDQVRRRYVSRIIVFPNGVALNVNANYQRRVVEGWEDSEDATVIARAKAEENVLGKAIQERFEAMSDE